MLFYFTKVMMLICSSYRGCKCNSWIEFLDNQTQISSYKNITAFIQWSRQMNAMQYCASKRSCALFVLRLRVNQVNQHTVDD